MASKRIYGSTANENISSAAVCSSTANVAGNYSLVTVSGRLSRTNTGYTTGGFGTFYLEINGTRYENSGYYEITYNSDTPVITVKDFKVPHNADGKKTIVVKFWGSIPGTTLTSINCSGTFTLDNIPRESKVSVNVSKAKAGDSITVSLARNVSSYTHDVTFKLGSRSATVTGVGASTTWTIPKKWQDQFPNSNSGTLSISAVTKSGSSSIGTTTTSVKITPSSDAAPSLSASISGVSLYWNLFIRTKSKAKITLNASGKYGATISRYSISGGGFSGTTNPYTTGYLLQAGDITFTCTVTDSRGISTTVYAKINVQSYDPPTILSPEVHRTDETGTEQINGNYIYAKAIRGFSSCGGNNTASMVVQYKENGGSYSSAVALSDGVPAILGDGNIVANKFYTVKITVSDQISSAVSQEFPIFTDRYRAAFGTEAAGVLRYPPDGGKGLYTTDIHAQVVDAENGYFIPDLREEELTPGMFGNRVLQPFFYPIGGIWKTILDVKGWTGNYDTTQVSFPADVARERDLKFRCGSGTSYTDWKTLIDNTNYINFISALNGTRFMNGWIGFYSSFTNAQNSTNRKGWIGHDGSENLQIVNEAGGKIIASGGDFQVDKELFLGPQTADSTAAAGTVWADGNYHHLVARSGDGKGLNAYFGWAGTSAYASLAQIRGQTVKCQNSSGTTTLSDERMKKDFANLEKWEEFYKSLDPVAFKMINGRSGRYHVGFKAQQIEQALLENDLTTKDFAGLVKMHYVPDEDDAEGNEAYKNAGIKPGDDEYGLIYSEFIALNTYMIQKLLKKIDTLEKEVSELKTAMNA